MTEPSQQTNSQPQGSVRGAEGSASKDFTHPKGPSGEPDHTPRHATEDSGAPTASGPRPEAAPSVPAHKYHSLKQRFNLLRQVSPRGPLRLQGAPRPRTAG